MQYAQPTPAGPAPTKGTVQTQTPSGRASSGFHATAVIVGLLFLSSTLAFAIGGAQLEASLAVDPPDRARLLSGVLLESYCGVAVAAIGVLLLAVLRPYGGRLAAGYTFLRVCECLVIVSAGTYMLSVEHWLDNYDLFVYVFTATGGIVLSYLLYTSKLIPRSLSALGLIGYSLLLLGIPGDLLGLADLDSPIGMALFFLPGGLFELALPVLLIIRGFRRTDGRVILRFEGPQRPEMGEDEMPWRTR